MTEGRPGKLDGRVGAAFFDQMAAEWRAEQARCQREIDRHQEADKSYMDEGVQILELARNAQRLFERQEPRQKRRLLNFVLSNCTWEDGEVVATFRQPFDLLAETTAIAAQAARDVQRNLTKSEIWLPGQVSNQCQPSKSSYRFNRTSGTNSKSCECEPAEPIDRAPQNIPYRLTAVHRFREKLREREKSSRRTDGVGTEVVPKRR